jgi:hypothetical protein
MFVKKILKDASWIDDPEHIAPDPLPEGYEVPQVAALVNKTDGTYVLVPGLKYTAGGSFKNISIRDRDDDAIMAYLNSVDVAEVLGRANTLIEAFATITGEVDTTEPATDSPAAADTVPGEVVASREGEAA